MEVPGYFTFNKKCLGNFQFGLVQGEMDWRVQDARLEFTWDEQSERERRQLVEELSGAVLRDRAALEELQADPVMRDTRRLEETERNADERQRDVRAAESALHIAAQRLQREADAVRDSAAQAAHAQQTLAATLAQATTFAQGAGIADADDYAQAAQLFAEPQQLAQADAVQFRAAQQALRDLAARRRTHLAQLQRRLRTLESAEHERTQEQRQRNERADELEDAAAQVAAAERAVEQCGAAVLDGWQRHCAGLRQLHIADVDTMLAALAEWVASLDGDNPARVALHRAQQQASQRLAERDAELRQQYRTLDAERAILHSERERLERGENKMPPVPYPRSANARSDRPGAPLWQLIEFRERVTDTQRAGLEAALEASGLLDAWVAPDGALLAADTFDTLLVERHGRAASLTYWFTPAEGGVVASEVVTRLLRSIACGDTDADSAEAWIAPSGQFRVGPARGAWSKPAAEYIGFSAREAARRRRLFEVDAAIDAIDMQLTEVRQQQEEVAQQRQQAADEWEQARPMMHCAPRKSMRSVLKNSAVSPLKSWRRPMCA